MLKLSREGGVGISLTEGRGVLGEHPGLQRSLRAGEMESGAQEPPGKLKKNSKECPEPQGRNPPHSSSDFHSCTFPSIPQVCAEIL